MPDVLVRNVPDPVLDAVKRRARQHRRSLQQELLSILEDVSVESLRPSPAEVAAAIRERLARSGRVFSDSTPLIREDRER
jgi:plasmid stability protein